jgi:hypothetical protein
MPFQVLITTGLQFVVDLRQFGTTLVDDECVEDTNGEQQVSFEHLLAIPGAHHCRNYSLLWISGQYYSLVPPSQLFLP